MKMNALLLKPTKPSTQLIRNYGVNAIRKQKGLPPRYAYSALSETAEFSYLDGRGYAPLNFRQQARYERDQYFGKQVIKYMEQLKKAKKLAEKAHNQQPNVEVKPNLEDEHFQ